MAGHFSRKQRQDYNLKPSYVVHNGTRLAYYHRPGSEPGILFCGGFNSDMHGIKATTLDNACGRAGIAYTRFDYRGHGASDGDFSAASIDSWLADTLAIIDNISQQRLILCGSSMGGWLAILATLARPDRIQALLTIAAAADFTERLLWPNLSSGQQSALKRGDTVFLPSQYDDGSPYPISPALINESRQHLVLNRRNGLAITVPVRLIHGLQDPDVPHQLSIELMEQIQSPDCEITLIKNGDHRLSSAANLDLIVRCLMALAEDPPAR